MHLFTTATLFATLTLVGVEFSVAAFLHPAASRLEPCPRKALLSRLAFVLGRVMPVWYPLCALLFAAETWLLWPHASHAVLLAADTLWALACVASILFLVPLNTRVTQGAPDWLAAHQLWDRRHRARVAVLATAAILLTSAVVG